MRVRDLTDREIRQAELILKRYQFFRRSLLVHSPELTDENLSNAAATLTLTALIDDLDNSLSELIDNLPASES